MKKVSFLFGVLLCTSGFLHAQKYEAVSKKQIIAASDEFSKNVMAGNWGNVANAYMTDAKLFPPNEDIVSGKTHILNFWTPKGETTSKIVYHKVYSEEIKINGKEAWDWGRYEGRSRMEDGSEVSWNGKYVIVWKEVARGTWKIYLDIWNRSPNAE